MDLRELTGLSDLDDFKLFYRTAVNKMGGPERFRTYIPFTIETLRQSYEKDPHFNTSLTPIRVWDSATGIKVPVGQTTLPPIAIGGGIWPLLSAHGITSIAQSQAVCLLKTAAKMLLEAKTAPGTART